MEEIVLNLGIRARHGMPTGGCLTVATTHIQTRRTDTPSGVPRGDVRLRISDTGEAMSAAVRSRLPVHVVLMSAFARDTTRHPSGDGFLAKPFAVGSLTAIIADEALV